jgi:SAM-dependent methyltransferase
VSAVPEVRTYSEQVASAGSSMDAIIEAALAAAQPAAGLRWLDVGCGRGDALRKVKERWSPTQLSGIDAIDWLDDDLRAEIAFAELPAERADELPAADRVLLIEVIEHLEAPWSALRVAAGLVAPGGRIVVSTPNVATLRTRLELAVRGQLTSFRPDNEPHSTPALPHVTARVLAAEGFVIDEPRYAGADVIPASGGRLWPEPARRRFAQLGSVSVIIAAQRPA